MFLLYDFHLVFILISSYCLFITFVFLTKNCFKESNKSMHVVYEYSCAYSSIANQRHDACQNSLICLLSCLCLFSLLKHSKKRISKLIIIYFIAWIIHSIAIVINDINCINLIKYFKPDNPTAYITNFVMYIASSLIIISLCYFIKIKLENTYKNTYLSINKSLINISFIIIMLTMLPYLVLRLCVDIFIVYDERLINLNDIYDKFKEATSPIQLLYYLLILVLFNSRLYRFIRLTMKNDEKLSMEITMKLKTMIIKQTNLISIIIYTTFIYSVIYVLMKMVNIINLGKINDIVWGWIYNSAQVTVIICVYLTHKNELNDKVYHKYCKYSHICCIWCCTKLIECKNGRHNMYQYKPIQYELSVTRKSVTRKSTVIPLLSTTDNPINVTTIFDECINSDGDICNIKDRMINTIMTYISKNDVQSISTTTILNDFHHVLNYHDEDQDFQAIYGELNRRNKHENHENCRIYSRYYRRRRDTDERQVDSGDINVGDVVTGDVMEKILDKIHSFYYHSYDTRLRSQCGVTTEIGTENYKIKDGPFEDADQTSRSC